MIDEIAPIAVLTALVSRPTPPSNWLPIFLIPPSGISPSAVTWPIRRSACTVITSRSAPACSAKVVPAK